MESANILAFLLVLPLFFVVGYANKKRERNLINAYLKQRDQQIFSVYWKSPPLFVRGGYYEVIYATSDLEIFRSECTIRSFSKLLWSEPTLLFKVSFHQWERMLKKKETNQNLSLTQIKTLTDREKITDGLTSSFLNERLWSVKQIRSYTEVEEKILFLLKDLAENDPEAEVRQAAVESLSKFEVIQ